MSQALTKSLSVPILLRTLPFLLLLLLLESFSAGSATKFSTTVNFVFLYLSSSYVISFIPLLLVLQSSPRMDPILILRFSVDWLATCFSNNVISLRINNTLTLDVIFLVVLVNLSSSMDGTCFRSRVKMYFVNFFGCKLCRQYHVDHDKSKVQLISFTNYDSDDLSTKI